MKRLALLSAAALLAGGAALGAITAPHTIPPALAEPTATATAEAMPSETPSPSATVTPSPAVTPTPTPSPATVPDCDNLKLGDAWAGVSLHCAKPTPEPIATIQPVPIPSEPAPADTPKLEDDPTWSCYTDGNKICGPKSAASATEAWELFNPGVFTDEELMQPFRVTYHGTVMQGVDLPPSDWYTVPSSEAGFDHAFSIEFGVTK